MRLHAGKYAAAAGIVLTRELDVDKMNLEDKNESQEQFESNEGSKLMRRAFVCAAVFALGSIGMAEAQEHFVQGPVWECSSYRTKPGKYSDYMEYLRKNVAKVRVEAEKQGLIVDQRVFVQVPSSPSDWNIMFCTAFKNGSAALDYDAEMGKKWGAISAAVLGTDDEEKQEAMAVPRFEMRDFIGSNMMREVELKPMD